MMLIGGPCGADLHLIYYSLKSNTNSRSHQNGNVAAAYVVLIPL